MTAGCSLMRCLPGCLQACTLGSAPGAAAALATDGAAAGPPQCRQVCLTEGAVETFRVQRTLYCL